MPTFSVAMCTYNGARFLDEQLQSIARQTRLPDEVVISDDRSEDETPRIVERFAAAAPFPVRFEVNAERLGLSRNFQSAIERTRGDLVALSDQDDAWAPEKLARLERAFGAGDEVGLVISNAEVVDERLQPLGYDLWKWVGFQFPGGVPAIAARGFHLALMDGISFGVTMAFHARHKEWILPIPDHPVIYKTPLPLHDKWIAMLIAAVAGVALVPERLTLYRQHLDQQTGAALMPRGVSRDAGGVQPLRRDAFERAARSFTELRAKVLANPLNRIVADERLELDEMIKHLEARARMPRNRVARVPRVLRELGSGRYARFGNGWRSAARDLV